MIKETGRTETVILGNPFSAKTCELCKEALPGVSMILPLGEVRLLTVYQGFQGFRFCLQPLQFQSLTE